MPTPPRRALLGSLFACTVFTAAALGNPVINEIHYNNENNSIANEFVELINPTAEDIDVSGWQLAGGLDYFSASAPPNIRHVSHTPEHPQSTESAVITAKVTDPEGVERPLQRIG